MSHTRGYPRIVKTITNVLHESERLLPLSGISGLVVVVKATRSGDVLAPSLVRCLVTSFVSGVATRKDPQILC